MTADGSHHSPVDCELRGGFRLGPSHFSGAVVQWEKVVNACRQGSSNYSAP